MVDAKKMWGDLNKIPIIGDAIISFGIIVVLISFSSAGGFWGLEGEKKELLIESCIIIGVIYFFISISIKAYKFFNK